MREGENKENKALTAGKILQIRVRRWCLDRVVCGLMHHYVEPGARAYLQDFIRRTEP